MKKIFALFIALFALHMSYGSNRTLSDRAQISILTCGTGNQLYSLFGHTAIRVFDPKEGIDRVYNYGMFNFRTPNFYAKFVKGDLLYFVVYEDYKNFVVNYAYDNRSVVEQELNLTPEQKQSIWQKLNESLAEDKRFYIYKFIDQNCTTKVVDVLNEVLPTPVQTAVEGNTATYRTILNTYLKDRYFEMLGINLIFGNKVDHPSTLLFLPDKFQLGLTNSTNGDQPLVKEETTVFKSQPVEGYVWWNTYWFASVMTLALFVLTLNKTVRSFYFILMGVLGVFFIAVGFYSLHEEILLNNVVFLCNPLFIIIPFVNNLSKIKSNLGIVVVIMLIVYFVLNFYSEKLIITLPLYLLTLSTLFLEYRTILRNRGKNKY